MADRSVRTLPRTAVADARSTSCCAGVGRMLGRSRQPQRETRQLLHRPVVQVSGDPPALAVRHVERALQRLLPLAAHPSQPPREDPAERDQQHGQRDQRHDEHGREVAQQLLPLLVDARIPLVGLEQQRRAVGCLDRRIDLEQRPRALLVSVLGRAQVGDLCRGLPAGELVQLARAALELLADRLELVGIQDRAVLTPQLHVDDRVVKHRVADHGRHLAGRGGVPGDDPVGHPLLDHVRREQRELTSVVDRAVDRHPTDHDERRARHERDYQHAEQDDHEDGPTDTGVAPIHSGDATRAPRIRAGPNGQPS